MTKSKLTSLILLSLITFMALPASAATFEVSGWIPWWREKEGAKSAQLNLTRLSEINPFGFAVKNDGTLSDVMGIKKSPWTKLIKEARKKKVKVVPTVMWSDGARIHEILTDEDKREKHIKAIVSMVKKGKYEGVDINYEGKLAATREGFSTFLTELDKALGSKYLSCTIESRTPPDSLYTTPREVQYVNDFKVIGQVCDRVKIMTYDQQRADIKLNAQNAATPYAPVSDVAWVRKVMTVAMAEIPKEKIMLGIPTYGYEYEIIASANRFTNYAKVWALNPQYGIDRAKEFNITPGRTAAGEMGFTYRPATTTPYFPTSLPVAAGSAAHNLVSAQSLSYSNLTGLRVPFYLVTWSDAEAVKQKVDLAKQLGIAGVAFFKIDGAEDKNIWKLF